MGLVGEAGELANKLKKHLRDGIPLSFVKQGMAAELGDVLWYVANLATELGYDLNDIANFNVEKLKSRQERGTLSGSGDVR